MSQEQRFSRGFSRGLGMKSSLRRNSDAADGIFLPLDDILMWNPLSGCVRLKMSRWYFLNRSSHATCKQNQQQPLKKLPDESKPDTFKISATYGGLKCISFSFYL